MDTSLEELEAIGKQAFEHAFQAGQFFFPKVLYKQVGGDMILAQYEGDFDQFRNLCILAASGGPLEFIEHTGDIYYLDAVADPETYKRIEAGETSASEQFEAENPAASEALAILVIDAQGTFVSRVVPYKRKGKTLVWHKPLPFPDSLQPQGRYAEVMAAAIKASYAAKDENTGG